MDIAITAGPPPLPPLSPVRGWPFWGTLGWAMVILILSTLIQALMFIAFTGADLYARRYLHDLTPDYLRKVFAYEMTRGDVVFSTVIIANLICIAAVLLVIVLKGRSARDYLAFHPVRMPVMLKWGAIVGAFVILAEVAAQLLHFDFGGDSMTVLYQATRAPWLFWVAAVLAAPLFEEVVFRGFLFRGFQPSFLGTPGTIALTAILWAALHVQYNFYGMGFIFGLGLLFGLARARSGSLVVTLTLHAVFNFFETLALALTGT